MTPTVDKPIRMAMPPMRIHPGRLQDARRKYFPFEPDASVKEVLTDLGARLGVLTQLSDRLNTELAERQETRGWGDAMEHAFQLAVDEVGHLHREVSNDFIGLFTS